MERLIFTLSYLLLAAYSTKGDNESPFAGGKLESDIETWYEVHYGAMIETIYDSLPNINTSTTHIQVLELKDHFDQVQTLEIQNSIAAAKILFLAEALKENEDAKDDAGAMEVVNDIIKKSTTFAKNLANGYACHGVEAIKYMTDDEPPHQENNEYIVFYNPDSPEKVSKAKIVPGGDGDKIMIIIERKHNRISFKYSILIDNFDYPEDIQTLGDIIARKVIAKEDTTDEEICAMNPKPKAIICIPMRKIFEWTVQDAIKFADTRFQIIEKHIKMCK